MSKCLVLLAGAWCLTCTSLAQNVPGQSAESASKVVRTECVSVDRIAEEQPGVVLVLLRNSCGVQVAAVSLHPIVADDPEEGNNGVDFMPGIGLPAYLAPPPGTEIGPFEPGTTRTTTFGLRPHQARVDVRVQGVIFVNGQEAGDTTSLQVIRNSWQDRLAELASLRTEMKSLLARGSDELDTLSYMRTRSAQLDQERKARNLSRRELEENGSKRAELRVYQTLVEKLTSDNGKGMGRAQAAALVRDLIESRFKAQQEFVGGLAKGGK